VFTHGVIERLLRQTQRPVLVVGNPDQSPYRRVLVPVDLTPASAAGARFAAAFLPRASLHLLHASRRSLCNSLGPLSSMFNRGGAAGSPSESTRSDHRQAVSCFVATLGLGERRARVSMEAGDPVDLVNDELARQKTDLLVLGTQDRSWVGHAFVRGGGGGCDILFAPPPVRLRTTG
jgi:nucleotide-binding universal stress UspA family protein